MRQAVQLLNEKNNVKPNYFNPLAKKEKNDDTHANMDPVRVKSYGNRIA